MPSSGNVLEWGTGTGVDFFQDTNNLLVGHSVAPTSGGASNVAFGGTALDSLTSGTKNIAVGHTAGTAITSGTGNV